MNQIRGKCVICSSTFTLDDIAALHCGHTFHFFCISEWVERLKTCPICRTTTTDSQIVKHLYFNGADDLNASQVGISCAAQVECLSVAIEQHQSILDRAIRMAEEVEAEQKYYREKIPLLEARNRQLEMMLVDQQELQKDLEQTENRLRACESHLDEARKTELKLKDELEGAQESVSTLKKEEHDLKNKVAILEKELRDVHGTANIGSTPFNPKPRSLAVDQRGLESNRPTGFDAVQGAAAKAPTSLEDRNGSTDVISRQPGLKRRLDQNDLDNQRLSHFSKKKSL